MENLQLEQVLAAVALIILTLYLFLRKPSKPEVKPLHDYKRIDPTQEKVIPIKELWLFPCRGVQGVKVDELLISTLGIKYDRQYILMKKENMM